MLGPWNADHFDLLRQATCDNALNAEASIPGPGLRPFGQALLARAQHFKELELLAARQFCPRLEGAVSGGEVA